MSKVRENWEADYSDCIVHTDRSDQHWTTAMKAAFKAAFPEYADLPLQAGGCGIRVSLDAKGPGYCEWGGEAYYSPQTPYGEEEWPTTWHGWQLEYEHHPLAGEGGRTQYCCPTCRRKILGE